MSSIQHLFIESLSGGVLEAGDTKITKIQPDIQRGHQKPHNYFFPQIFSFFWVPYLSWWQHTVPKSWNIWIIFDTFSLTTGLQPNSKSLLLKILQVCALPCCLAVADWVCTLSSSELLWQEPPNCFLCFEIIPSFPYPPRAFRFQSCFMKTKIVSYHFPIFKPFLNVLCTFEVAKTSAGATHKQVIQGREEQQVEEDGDLC